MEKPKNLIEIESQSTLIKPNSPENEQELTNTMTTLQPNFMKSIEELSNLSTAILNFKSKFDDLNTHLEFISNSIDAKFNQLPQQLIEKSIPLLTICTQQLNSHNGSSPKQDTETTETEISKALNFGGGRGLRKYLIDNLANIDLLRKQVPAFLKKVQDPARVVLDCVGKFYCQGIRAYAQDCPLIQVRQASVLMLELFLSCLGERLDDVKVVKEEAEVRAIAWKNRMVGEGGVSKACEIDARGLLLFIACFGIPRVFRDDDVGDLIMVSNLEEIGDLVRQSHVIVVRIPGIIKQMVKNKMNIEAAEIAYTFGVEKEISLQKILNSLLENSRQKAKAAKGETGYLRLLNRQLADLRSVKKFIKNRNLDPAKVVPGWQIVKTIISLEKEIAELEKKEKDQMNLKRTYNQNESSNHFIIQESKRSRFSPQDLRYSPMVGYQEQKAVHYLDSTRSLYNHAAPLASYGSGRSSLLENYIGAGRSVIDMHNTGLAPRVSSGYDDMASPYNPVYGVNNSATLNLQHRVLDASYETRLAGRSVMEQSPTIERFPGLLNSRSIGTSSDLYRFADTVSDSDIRNNIGSSRARPAPPSSSTYRAAYMYP
ncbi:hypothetical protein ACFE04_027590 [Oxalis oulophora]